MITLKTTDTAELKRKIKAGDIAPAYFLYGNEQYLINHYTDLIIKSSVTALEEINLKIIDSDFNVDEIASIAYQVPMMSAKKCIVLSDFDLSKINASQLKSLIELLENPSDVAVIIFKYTGIELSFSNKFKMRSQSKNYQTVVAALEKGGGTVSEINHLTPGETARTITAGAARRGCVLEPGTARYMIERCTDDLTTLLCEIEKVCSYKGEGEIKKEDIDKICTKSFSAVIFDMAKAVLSKNITRSLDILNSLLFQHTKELDILRELTKNYIDIYRVQTARSCGVSNDKVAADFGYGARAFMLKNAAGYAAKIEPAAIAECLKLLSEAEYNLKGGSRLPKGDVLRTLISELVVINSR